MVLQITDSFPIDFDCMDPYANVVTTSWMTSFGQEINQSSSTNLEPVFEERDLQIFWDARHESLWYNKMGNYYNAANVNRIFPSSIQLTTHFRRRWILLTWSQFLSLIWCVCVIYAWSHVLWFFWHSHLTSVLRSHLEHPTCKQFQWTTGHGHIFIFLSFS